MTNLLYILTCIFNFNVYCKLIIVFFFTHLQLNGLTALLRAVVIAECAGGHQEGARRSWLIVAPAGVYVCELERVYVSASVRGTRNMCRESEGILFYVGD